MRIISIILFLLIGFTFGNEPCVYPIHHWMQYQTSTDTDIAAVYLRVDKYTQITPGYVEGTGEMIPMTRRGVISFMLANWLNTENPKRPKFDLNWFCILSKHYVPETSSVLNEIETTVEIAVEEPIVTEPNELVNDNALGQICYTIGGKQHLYQDCRYLKDKEWIPCVCDPNNFCLTCVARKAQEEYK